MSQKLDHVIVVQVREESVRVQSGDPALVPVRARGALSGQDATNAQRVVADQHVRAVGEVHLVGAREDALFDGHMIKLGLEQFLRNGDGGGHIVAPRLCL